MSLRHDSIADQYRQSRQAPWRRYVERHTLSTLLGDLTALSVIDVACADGEAARVAIRRGARRVLAVDASPRMIELAHAEDAKEPTSVEYRVHDPKMLELDETFDVLLVSFVLWPMSSTRSLYDFMHRAAAHLKPGGQLLALANNPNQSPYAFDATKKYGLFKTVAAPPRDGTPILLTIVHEETKVSIESSHLTAPTLELACSNAGLRRVRWHRPDVAPEARNKFAPDYWYDFLSDPPLIFLEAQKP